MEKEVPVRRKRGRPRKFTVPATLPEDVQVSSQDETFIGFDESALTGQNKLHSLKDLISEMEEEIEKESACVRKVEENDSWIEVGSVHRYPWNPEQWNDLYYEEEW